MNMHKPSDRVSVANLCLHGYHGVLPEERRLGQKFFLDVDCHLDLAAAAAADDYRRTLCYAALCELTAEISARAPCDLIETLAQRVAEGVLAQFDTVRKVTVRVRKPTAPIALTFAHVEVEVTRHRNSSNSA